MKLKKALAALMLACLVLLALPLTARAEEIASGSCSDTVTWTLSDDGTLTVSGTGPIPDNVREWADYEAQIRHVVVQEGITAVGRANFSYHSALESVELPSTVASLGNSAFDNCTALKQINIPAGVTEIPGGAFSFCEALPSIVLPEGLKSIGGEAFMQCLSLEEIQIPQSVTTIGHNAFSICHSLEKVTVPSGVTELNYRVFAACISLKEVEILGPITALPDSAFYYCRELRSIELPDTLTSIGSECFYRCDNLTGITFPAALSSIDSYAFSLCDSLSSVVFSGDPPTWGSNVFNGCTLTAFYPAGNSAWTAAVMGDQGGTVTWKVYTPGETLILASGKCGANLNWSLDQDCTLTITGTGAMYDWTDETKIPWYDHRDRIRKVVIGEGASSIGENAFYYCDTLTEVQLPQSLRKIGTDAFLACYVLKELTLPSGLTELAESALRCTGVEHLTIPGGITALPVDVLRGCEDLLSVTLPAGLKSIGFGAFEGCEALTEINIPDGVTFGENAFFGCTALREKYDSLRTPLALETETAGSVEIPDLYAFHYTFTPAVTEKYTFCTWGVSDTYGTITDGEGTVLAEDDDSGEGSNCAVSAVLEAGKTYLFNVSMNDPCAVGDFTGRVTVAHAYTDTVTKAATCTAAGIRTWKCSHCTDSYTETIPAAHSFSGGKCTVCGKTESYPMAKRNPQTMFSTLSIAKSNNYNDHFYGFYGYAANTVKSVLAEENGGYLRVEYTGGKLQVEWYTRDFTLYSRKTLNLELPVYGGVYICQDYNFVVSGQNNTEENNNKEVFRITCYDKNWNRVGAASLKGANTTIPFDAGSLRMARCEDILYVRTCHEMFTSGDGLNHQANVTISIRISDMTVIDALYGVSNNGWGYVSHSFNQLVQVDGNDFLAMDHGDAHPRGVMIFRNAGTAGKGDFNSDIEKVQVLTIAENTGHYNTTGVSVNGFEYSDTHYLVAGNTCPQTGGINQGSARRNIFVTATDKNNFTEAGTKIYYLTNYSQSSRVNLSPPHLVKMDNNRFCLIWSADGTIYYCLLNGQGQRTSGIINGGSGYLSDCKPIWADGRIVWYAGTGGNPVFYQIAVDKTAVSAHTHSLSNIIETMPTQNATGVLAVTCSKCDFSYRITLPALSSGQYTKQSETQPSCTKDGVLTYLWRSTAYGELTIKKITPALMHDYSFAGGTTYTCARCGDSFTLGQDEYLAENVRRISGADRCLTALNVAEALKKVQGVEKFDTIIIANGINFADALSGSYLASVKEAPILLYHPAAVDKNQVYIQNNLAPGGTVYILGGTAAIPAKVENGLAGCTVKRLSGADRFATNLEILKEAGVGDKEILVATGENFADSLSASATGLPILLVYNATHALTPEQTAFLSGLEGNSITIVGGPNAVGTDFETMLAAYGTVSRISGADRHETSVLLAQRYFPEPECMLLAYSMNYPDGLCGGPLGYALGAPLVLTAAGGENRAADYVQDNAITEGIILGGKAALSEETAAEVFHLYEEPEDVTEPPAEEETGTEADTVNAPEGDTADIVDILDALTETEPKK